MKRVLIIFSFFLTFNFVFAFSFNFPYQYLVDYNQDKILIKVSKNDDNKDYYVCDLNNLNCEYQDKTLPNLNKTILPENFFSEDFDLLISQIKIENKYFTLLFKKQNEEYNFNALIPFYKKINKVFFSKDNKKSIFISNNYGYVFDVQKNKISKNFRLTPKFSYISASPSLKYLALYYPAAVTNPIRKFVLFDVDKNKEEIFEKEKLDYWDLLSENNKIFEFIDEEKLLFLDDKDNFQTLYLYDIGNKKISKLFDENFVIKDFVVSSNLIYFTANKENKLKWDLYSYDLDTKNIKKILDNVAYDFSLMKIKNFLIAKEAGEFPPKIVLIDSSNNKQNLNLDLNPEKIKIGEILNFENIYSVILKPDNFDSNKEYNLLVWLHGGPHRQSSLGYHPYFSYGIYDYLLDKIKDENFIVAKIDYKGSFGYGRDFANLKNKIGKDDIESILKIVDYLKNNFKIEKIYLMGNSYGGYLSLKTIYEKPEIFEGAISINGVTDWFELISSRPSSIFSIHFNGAPNKSNINLYNQASIFLDKGRLKNKRFLIIYGENDKTVPNHQSKLFYNIYKDISNIAIKSYDDDHIISSEESLKNLCLDIFDFLNINSEKCKN
jgi:dipeptidyl aminopeptidase/acylaminoacyl peptidase